MGDKSPKKHGLVVYAQLGWL